MKNNTTDISQKVANLFIDIGAVSFRFDPPFTFSSGIKSPIYLDNRVILSYPHVRNQIIDYYIEVIRKNICLSKIDYISATASAAIPQGSLIAYRLGLPLVYVRPSTKLYGKGNKIEGFLKKGSNVLIIEDHVSTGASIVNNARTIRESGSSTSDCIATTTYQTKESISLLVDNKINLWYLTTGNEIIKQAFMRKLIKKKEMQIIKKWFNSPRDWILQ